MLTLLTNNAASSLNYTVLTERINNEYGLEKIRKKAIITKIKVQVSTAKVYFT